MSIPAHKQTDPAKAPGQVINPVGQPHKPRQPATLAQYIARVQAEENESRARAITAHTLFKAASRRLVGESA